MTWWVGIAVPSCFPHQAHTNTGTRLTPSRNGFLPRGTSPRATFARMGRPATAFPIVIAHIRPSDSPLSFGLGSGSPCLRPTSRKVSCFFAGFRVHLQNTAALGASGAALREPQSPRGDHGVSQVTGPSSSCVPAANYLAGRVVAFAHLCGDDPAAFRPSETLGCAGTVLSMADATGPHARLPTHQRIHCRRRCKAGYRPAGLSFGRTGFAPAGRHIRFQGGIDYLLSQLTSIAWSHPEADKPFFKKPLCLRCC